jgi:uncharacterized protein
MERGRRTALVTGPTSGIGRAFADLLARDGYRVVLVGRKRAVLDEVAEDLRARFDVPSHIVVADLGEPRVSEQVFAEVGRLGLFVEVLINNAGFATYGKFAEISLRDEREEMNVNVLALTELTKLFLPAMLEQRQGKILNLASTAAFQPGPLMAVYYATKAYVLSFSEAISNELEGTGVTVTCLAPGATASGFQSRAKMERARLVKNRKLPDAMSVARAGYDAMLKGQRLVIPGKLNQLLALAPRISPRGAVLRVSRATTDPH